MGARCPKGARLLMSAFFGSVLGVAASFVVNCALIEVTLNEFVAVYLGVIFMLIAAILFWRVIYGSQPNPKMLSLFAFVVFLAGVSCFCLERSWFVRMHWGAKVPLYSLLGIAVCFAFIYSVVDLANYLTTACSLLTPPLVDTKEQVHLVLLSAILMGLSFGLTFGLLDVEDEPLARLKVALRREQSYCYPIGALLGGAAAILNQLIREARVPKWQTKYLDGEFDPS